MFCVVHTCVHHVMLLAGSRHRVAAVSGEKPPQEPDGRTVFMGGWNQSSLFNSACFVCRRRRRIVDVGRDDMLIEIDMLTTYTLST